MRVRKRLVYYCIVLLVLLTILFYDIIRFTYFNVLYHTINEMMNSGVFGCSIRKPVLPELGDGLRIFLVWESNCPLSNVNLETENSKTNEKSLIRNIQYEMIDESHYVFRTWTNNTSTFKYTIELPWGRMSKSVMIKEENPIKIAYLADNQFKFMKYQNILEHVQHHNPNYVLHGGDAIQDHWNIDQWQTDFFDPVSRVPSLLEIPWIMVHGNHDYRANIKPFYKYEESWYSFQIGNAKFIVLDSNQAYNSNQMHWFKAELQKDETKTAKFRIVMIHVPPFIEYWEPNAWQVKKEKKWNEFIRSDYVPLFEKNRVNLVLSGHQHNYQRGDLNNGKRNRHDIHSCIVVHYMTCGGAGGDLDQIKVEDYGFFKVTAFEHHYSIIEIGNDAMNIKTIDIYGEKIDEFSIE